MSETKKYPKPRNTLVLVRELEMPESKVGSVIIASGFSSEMYMMGEVLAIGPGNRMEIDNVAQTSETTDLRVGQRVWIQAKKPGRHPGKYDLQGCRHEYRGEFLYLFEQMQVLVILDEPGEWDRAEHEDDLDDNTDGGSLIITGDE